jgi:pantothenate kinase
MILLQEDPDRTINVTGGGAYKYSDLISEKLGLKVTKVDEMDCICAGANFLLKNIADESFSYERSQSPHYKFQSSNPSDLYPYLLVTIGSGVSVIKVNSETDFERIGGTATGGGTFWGLGRLLTGF